MLDRKRILVMNDIDERYQHLAASPKYERIYEGDRFAEAFAYLHEQLDRHFQGINGRAESTRHYWAENSREFISLISQVYQELRNFKLAGVDVTLARDYEDAIERCRPWLSPSGGSAVPDDFHPIEVIEYDRVFLVDSTVVELEHSLQSVQLEHVGSGSYGSVYSYTDPNYGIKFAIKKMAAGATEREIERFRLEYEVLSGLNFPYIVQVFGFNRDRFEYRMEYCDTTLLEYVKSQGARLPNSSRKRIALQLLYGLNYLHKKGHLHRDISLRNTLLKLYDSGAVVVKLSDFGLVKLSGSTFTNAYTQVRGTYIDPFLGNFAEYSVKNEIYSVGHVLAYLFTGLDSIPAPTDRVGEIIHKCVSSDLEARYNDVLEIISDIEALDFSVKGQPA